MPSTAASGPGPAKPKAKAVTATARKIAVLFYNTLRYGMVYADPGASYYEARYRQRAVANLRRRAKSLGFTVEEYPTVAEGVSWERVSGQGARGG